MSKKRFIKLMMARGYSRNTASALAMQVSRYGSYAAMYQRLAFLPSPMLLQALLRTVHETIHRAFDTLAVTADAAAASLAAFAESMRRAADE